MLTIPKSQQNQLPYRHNESLCTQQPEETPQGLDEQQVSKRIDRTKQEFPLFESSLSCHPGDSDLCPVHGDTCATLLKT